MPLHFVPNNHHRRPGNRHFLKYGGSHVVYGACRVVFVRCRTRYGVSSTADAGRPALFIARIAPHAVFDVVIDDEIQLFVAESVMRGQHPVYFINDWFGT